MEKISYTYEQAGEATGYSKDVIRRAVDNHQMVARWANTKPVIKAAELHRWVDSLPTERP